jgi:hypothetical protein
VTRLCFLTTTGSNGFMTELLHGIAAAVGREGVEATVATDAFPAHRDDTAYVLVPHEFFETAPLSGRATERHLQRTIGLCVEQPGTQWFERASVHAKRLGALVDIREEGAVELRRRGLAVERVRLGYVPDWDHWHRDLTAERPVDVLFMGSIDARRAAVLAGYAPTLWTRRARLLTPSEEPRIAQAPDHVVGGDKLDLLASSRVLLNVHRDGASGMEWPRVLESIANGCVVVTEHALDHEPLVAGEHFLQAPAENLATIADLLLDDPQRLAAIRVAAYDFVRAELTMQPAARRLIEIATELSSRRVRYADRRLAPVTTLGPAADPAGAQDPAAPALGVVGAGLKRLAVEMLELRRGAQPRSGRPGALRLLETRAYATARPSVSICITVHDYEREVVEALRSVSALEEIGYEVVVIDDASIDASRERVADFADAHPWLPLVLLGHDVNAGLGQARNAAVAQARGDLVLTLDADNQLYPSALERLVGALEADAGASFAYGTLAVYDGDAPVDLLSHRPWEPDRLRLFNYIDALALIRREALDLVGGYTTDARLLGYEDYDLWCRFAERGLYGAHVPEIVARYRRSQHSMIGLTQLDDTVARSVMRSRAPNTWAEGAIAAAEGA